MRERVLALFALAAIVVGGALWLAGEEGWADAAWGLGAAIVLVPLVVDTARSLLRGDVGVDAIALVGRIPDAFERASMFELMAGMVGRHDTSSDCR